MSKLYILYKLQILVLNHILFLGSFWSIGVSALNYSDSGSQPFHIILELALEYLPISANLNLHTLEKDISS